MHEHGTWRQSHEHASDGYGWSIEQGWHSHDTARDPANYNPNRREPLVTSGANLLFGDALDKVAKAIIDRLHIDVSVSAEDGSSNRLRVVQLLRDLSGAGLAECARALKAVTPCASCGTRRGEVRE